VSGNVLVVQTAFLGDLVLTTPLLRELRRTRPDGAITVVTTPTGADVLRGLPFVDALHVYDKRAGVYGLRGLARTVATLRRNGGLDVAIAAQRSSRSGFVVRLSGAASRIGFAGAAGEWAYTARLPFDRSRHAVDRLLSLSAPVGGDPDLADRTPVLAVRDGEREDVARMLAGAEVDTGRPLACLAPGSRWATKRWLPEGFARIGRELLARGHAVVLLGTSAERDLCERVRAGIGSEARSLAGELGVRQLIATVARAALLVANDSGPAHVAAAVGTPVVSVFGPTTPSLGFAPLGDAVRIVEHESLDCRPCDRHGPNRCPLGHFRCMREIGADRVVAAIDDLAVDVRSRVSDDRGTPPAPPRTPASLVEGRRG
jgi:heptosyltransferase-2